MSLTDNAVNVAVESRWRYDERQNRSVVNQAGDQRIFAALRGAESSTK